MSTDFGRRQTAFGRAQPFRPMPGDIGQVSDFCRLRATSTNVVAVALATCRPRRRPRSSPWASLAPSFFSLTRRPRALRCLPDSANSGRRRPSLAEVVQILPDVHDRLKCALNSAQMLPNTLTNLCPISPKKWPRSARFRPLCAKALLD